MKVFKKGDKIKRIREDVSFHFVEGLKQGGWTEDSELAQSLKDLDTTINETLDAMEAKKEEKVEDVVINEVKLDEEVPVKKTRKPRAKKPSVNE